MPRETHIPEICQVQYIHRIFGRMRACDIPKSKRGLPLSETRALLCSVISAISGTSLYRISNVHLKNPADGIFIVEAKSSIMDGLPVRNFDDGRQEAALCLGFRMQYHQILKKLGKHFTGKVQDLRGGYQLFEKRGLSTELMQGSEVLGYPLYVRPEAFPGLNARFAEERAKAEARIQNRDGIVNMKACLKYALEVGRALGLDEKEECAHYRAFLRDAFYVDARDNFQREAAAAFAFSRADAKVVMEFIRPQHVHSSSGAYPTGKVPSSLLL